MKYINNLCYITASIIPLIAIIISGIMFLNFNELILFSSMILIGFGISLSSFLYTIRNGKSMHHWQFALMALILLIPPVTYNFTNGQNDLSLFLMLFILTICVTVFIKDIPDFIQYFNYKKNKKIHKLKS